MRMKPIAFCTALSLFFAVSAFSGENVGYKEFALGQSRDEVKGIIAAKYAGKNTKQYTDGDIMVSPDEMIKTFLYFDHQNVLYKIHVQLKYGDIAEVKKRLLEKWGQANEFTNEEYDSGNKLYLVGRWLIEKKYRLSLWEGYYCRNQRMNPCVVEVNYLDAPRNEARLLHERSQKEETQKKKDAKTYDGF